MGGVFVFYDGVIAGGKVVTGRLRGSRGRAITAFWSGDLMANGLRSVGKGYHFKALGLIMAIGSPTSQMVGSCLARGWGGIMLYCSVIGDK